VPRSGDGPPTPRPRQGPSTAMRPIWPLASSRAVPMGRPSRSSARRCTACPSRPSHSSSMGTPCSATNTCRRIARRASRSVSQKARRNVNSFGSEFQVAIVVEPGPEYQSGIVIQLHPGPGDRQGAGCTGSITHLFPENPSEKAGCTRIGLTTSPEFPTRLASILTDVPVSFGPFSPACPPVSSGQPRRSIRGQHP